MGVDGTSDGWVAVIVDGAGLADARPYSNLAAVIQAVDADTFAVDIPIGLPTAERWPRRADMAARRFIAPLSASVFVVAPEQVLTAPTHAAAVLRCRELGIAGISQQAWALRAKIEEAAACAQDPRVHEVHPEVSFAAMNGQSLRFGKHTWNGHQERRRILASVGLPVPDEIGNLGRARVDDVLDAVAAAWSAQRIASGNADYLPADATDDEPRIWY